MTKQTRNQDPIRLSPTRREAVAVLALPLPAAGAGQGRDLLLWSVRKGESEGDPLLVVHLLLPRRRPGEQKRGWMGKIRRSEVNVGMPGRRKNLPQKRLQLPTRTESWASMRKKRMTKKRTREKSEEEAGLGAILVVGVARRPLEARRPLDLGPLPKARARSREEGQALVHADLLEAVLHLQRGRLCRHGT